MVIALGVFVLLLAIGFGTVYFFNSYLRPTLPAMVSRQVQEPKNSEPVQPPATDKATPAVKTEVSVKPPAGSVSVPVQPPAKVGQVRETGATGSVKPASAPKEIALQDEKKILPTPQSNKDGLQTDKAPETPAHTSKKPSLPTNKTRKQSNLNETVKTERDINLYSAKTYENDKNYGQAIAHYKKALENDPRNYLIMNSLASIFIKTRSYKESLQYSMNALAVQNNYVPSLTNLGIANIQLGNTTEGEMYLVKGKSLEPSNKTVLFNLGLLYEKQANYPESFAIFQRLADMKDPEGYLGTARVLEKQGKRAEAEKIYNNILWMDNIDPAIKQLASERLQVNR